MHAHMGVIRATAEWHNPKKGKKWLCLIVRFCPAPRIRTGRPWWHRGQEGLQTGGGTSPVRQGLPQAPMNLVMVFLFFCLVWSHVHLVPHKQRTKWAFRPQRPQTLKSDARDQSRWMDKRIPENNGKTLIWMTHCEHNKAATRNKWKNWIQKVLQWKTKNFVWWPYRVTVWLEFHSWHCL